jgi:hypothetical protein
MDQVKPLEAVLRGLGEDLRVEAWHPANPWPR